jgi:hypothetical protein
VFADAEESFGGTKVGVRGSSLCYLFATDRDILVSKGEAAREDGAFIYFIQSIVGSNVCHVLVAALDSKRGVAQTEGLRAPGVRGDGVFGRAKEPVEGEDGEVDDMGVDTSMDLVVGFEDSEQVSDDGDVGRVGSLGRVVLVLEALEESSEYGMVADSSRNFFSGIWLTQVGYPLPHRQNGVRDSISSDRVVFLSFLSVTETKDEEVGDLVFLSGDV